MEGSTAGTNIGGTTIGSYFSTGTTTGITFLVSTASGHAVRIRAVFLAVAVFGIVREDMDFSCKHFVKLQCINLDYGISDSLVCVNN